jgi:hypothetical protein
MDQTVPVDVEFKDLLDQLSFLGIMLHGEMHKGRWTILTDVIYVRVRENGFLRNPPEVASAEIAQFFLEISSGYSIFKLQDYLSAEGLFGVRYLAVNTSLNSDSQNLFDKDFDFVDPYLGIRLKSVNGKWINRASFDFGGFSLGSRLSWKLNLLVGYQINDRLALYLGYRLYDVDYENNSDSFNYDITTSGFMTGLNIHF